MSWFPVDDAFHSHPKARKAGLEAIGLWSVSGSYCMAYLTDGFVPEWFVKEKPRGTTLAKRLVGAGLWRPGVNDEGEPGFWFHDWKKECTKEHVLDVREKARQRKAKQRDSHEESRVTDDVSHADVPPTTQPNPTQPISNGVDLGGELTQVAPTEPQPQCPRHLNHTDPPPCQGCRQAREANEAWNATELDRRRAARADAKAIADACPICQGTNWIPDTDPAVKCHHREHAHA